MVIYYDYSELIQELNEELNDGILKHSDTIQIYRTPDYVSLQPGVTYRPIVDWYYDHKTMMESFTPEPFDEIHDIKAINEAKRQYAESKPYLKSVTVAQCLEEMKQWNEVL